MRLVSCYIENFGIIRNKDFDLSKDFVEIKQDNSTGKTTLANFIISMFYGMPDKRTGRKDELENPRKKYDPWEGGNFSGSLIFELDGKKYQIERNFNKKDDDFKLTEVNTKKDVEKIGKELIDSKTLGDVLFGIGKTSFERSAFVPQGDIITPIIETDMNEKLRNLINATDANNNLNNAKKILENAEKKIETARGGKIKELDRQIAEMHDKIDECETFAENAEEEKIELKDLEDELKDCVKELKALEKKITQAQKEEKIRAERGHYQSLVADKNKYKNQVEQLKNFADVDIDELKTKIDKVGKAKEELNAEQMRVAGVKTSKPSFIFVLLCIITLGLALLFKKKQPQTISLVGQLTEQYNIATQIAEKELATYGLNGGDMWSRFYEIKSKSEQYNTARKELRSATSKLEDFLSDKDEEKLKVEIPFGTSLDELKEQKEEFEEQKDDLNNQITELKISIEKNEDNASDIEDHKSELAEMEDLREKLKATQSIIQKAKDFLIEADENQAEQYISPLKEKCCEHIALFAPEKSAVFFDGDTKIYINEKGKDRELGYFSLGNKELISLCMRFALVDTIFKNKERKPCIILDDPFVNLDDKKLEIAKKFIKDLAKNYQIIYLTCHESRKIGGK